MLNLKSKYDLDIVSLSEEILRKTAIQLHNRPNDTNQIILHESNLTKLQVSQMINEFAVEQRLSSDGKLSILTMLNKFFPNIDWPIHRAYGL
jgi:hypothetical protein